MDKGDRIYIPPRRRPLRLPPDYDSEDRLNGERMLGAVLLGIIAMAAIGLVIWFVRGAS